MMSGVPVLSPEVVVRRSVRRLLAILASASVGASACTWVEDDQQSTGGSRPSPSISVAGTRPGRSVTVVAAGDIAKSAAGSRATAQLVRSLRPDAVLTLGDNAYDDGSVSDYADKYDPTWGRFKDITRPVPGNHEYHTEGAGGYFDYFAGQVRGNAYYAWNAGAWRMYALNCEIDCSPQSRQLRWLRRDVAAHGDRPMLAYLHRPRFTCSTRHPPDRDVSALWSVLHRSRGRILLSGHNHAYERFAPLDASGRRDPDGLRQFVVGTGGAGLYRLEQSCRHRLAAADHTTGVLVLRLEPRRFTWRFVSVTGATLDRGSGVA